MPQASAQDMLEDVITAYDFLRTELLTAPEFNKRTIYTYWSKRSSKVIGPSPFLKIRFEHYFGGPATAGSTPPGPPAFDVTSLLQTIPIIPNGSQHQQEMSTIVHSYTVASAGEQIARTVGG
ncbi:hypothetical protein ACMFMG_001670 [Clarireedia jacksonii]